MAYKTRPYEAVEDISTWAEKERAPKDVVASITLMGEPEVVVGGHGSGGRGGGRGRRGRGRRG